MTFAREDVARACRAWGRFLWLPPEIDGPKLLWALSGCESSFGANAVPRHEPAYDVGGEYATNPEQAKLLELYPAPTTGADSPAACSYGPWQIMLVNCSAGTSPDEMVRLERCAMETTHFINRRILKAEKAMTIAEIAEAYNSGKWQWTKVPDGVERYAADCVKYYESEPMPQSGMPAAPEQQ